MGKKKKVIEETSQKVASKAAKLLSKKFTKDLDKYLVKFMKIEKKLDKINENIQTTRCDLEDLLNEFQDFILAKKDDIKSVAASALTQASGEDVEDEGDSGSDTRNAGKKTI